MTDFTKPAPDPEVADDDPHATVTLLRYINNKLANIQRIAYRFERLMNEGRLLTQDDVAAVAMAMFNIAGGQGYVDGILANTAKLGQAAAQEAGVARDLVDDPFADAPPAEPKAPPQKNEAGTVVDTMNGLKFIPNCPECGGEMAERDGRYGEFYGCMDYPDCRGLVNINDDGTLKYRKGQEPVAYTNWLAEKRGGQTTLGGTEGPATPATPVEVIDL